MTAIVPHNGMILAIDQGLVLDYVVDNRTFYSHEPNPSDITIFVDRDVVLDPHLIGQ
jgi:hypothetical protein